MDLEIDLDLDLDNDDLELYLRLEVAEARDSLRVDRRPGRPGGAMELVELRLKKINLYILKYQDLCISVCLYRRISLTAEPKWLSSKCSFS